MGFPPAPPHPGPLRKKPITKITRTELLYIALCIECLIWVYDDYFGIMAFVLIGLILKMLAWELQKFTIKWWNFRWLDCNNFDKIGEEKSKRNYFQILGVVVRGWALFRELGESGAPPSSSSSSYALLSLVNPVKSRPSIGRENSKRSYSFTCFHPSFFSFVFLASRWLLFSWWFLELWLQCMAP